MVFLELGDQPIEDLDRLDTSSIAVLLYQHNVFCIKDIFGGQSETDGTAKDGKSAKAA